MDSWTHSIFKKHKDSPTLVTLKLRKMRFKKVDGLVLRSNEVKTEQYLSVVKINFIVKLITSLVGISGDM
jgi:hypothetical protein